MDLDDKTKKDVGIAIKEHIARSGLSRDGYCIQHRIAKSTLNKMVTGVFTEAGLAKLERRVGRSFRNRQGTLERASDDLGGYLHVDQKHFVGDYTLIRNSFETVDQLCLFPVRIDWDDVKPGLQMSSAAKDELKKSAYLAFPKGSPYLFVEANQMGWMSLMIFGTMDIDIAMRGVLLTTGNIAAGIYAPFFMPVLLMKESIPYKRYREIDQNDMQYAKLRKLLSDTISKNFVRFPLILPPGSKAT